MLHASAFRLDSPTQKSRPPLRPETSTRRCVLRSLVLSITTDVVSLPQVYIEEGIPESTVQALRELGHDARPTKGFGRSTFGRGQIIQQTFDETSGRRVWAAGSDLRGDGHAAAQI